MSLIKNILYHRSNITCYYYIIDQMTYNIVMSLVKLRVILLHHQSKHHIVLPYHLTYDMKISRLHVVNF